MDDVIWFLKDGLQGENRSHSSSYGEDFQRRKALFKGPSALARLNQCLL
jgi:hypothetical protein